ncbi:vWA domain-containing protein [Aurantivibrio plasticivorans]
MLEFDLPWLWWLLPLPILIWLAPRAPQTETALRVPFYRLLSNQHIENSTSNSSPRLYSIAIGCLWVCILAAAARPRWFGEPVSLPSSGRDLLLAVDISGSMKTADMVIGNDRVDRLTAVKAVVSEFVERRQTDRLGLILFGTNAYLQAPLTFDRNTVQTLLLEARLGFAGEKTAIGDAIGLATKRLLNRPENSRVLILLTDGANTAGEVNPIQAAELAKQTQVKIYTIGVGADELVVPGIFGSDLGARRMNPSADLDEKTLQQIAEITGGEYFRAKDITELQEIYAKLDILETIEQEAETFRPTTALFYWTLTIALALSIALAFAKRWPIGLNRSTPNNTRQSRPIDVSLKAEARTND